MEIVRQGKYECGAAAAAQILGEKLFFVKRVLGRLGWRNDDSGLDTKTLRKAMNHYGKDLVWLGSSRVQYLRENGLLPDCIVTVPSLNYKGRYHAVSYLAEHNIVVDPNTGNSGRMSWSFDSDFVYMGISGADIVIDRVLTEKELEGIKEARKGRKLIDYLIEINVLKTKSIELANSA